jgi:hypothetical protein
MEAVLSCVDLEIYLFIYFALLILVGNIAVYRMRKNVTKHVSKQDLENNFLKAFLWEIAIPKIYLTERGMLWRKVSIGCCIGFIVFVICWGYLPKLDWVCAFKTLPA